MKQVDANEVVREAREALRAGKKVFVRQPGGGDVGVRSLRPTARGSLLSVTTLPGQTLRVTTESVYVEGRR